MIVSNDLKYGKSKYKMQEQLCASFTDRFLRPPLRFREMRREREGFGLLSNPENLGKFKSLT